MRTDFFTNRKIWLTGASAGIGRACALEFAGRGAILAISGRDEKALAELKHDIITRFPGASVTVVPFDVTDKSAHHHAVNNIQNALGGIDIAFLNAGISEFVNVKEFDSNVFERIMKVNYLGVVYGIEAVLPVLRESPCAQLVGMASLASYGGLPMGEAYSASKAAVRNLFQGLAVELHKENIGVSVVCPGFVRTRLIKKNNFHMPMVLSPEKAAKIICNGIAKKRYEIHFPKPVSLFFKILTCLPGWMYTRLLANAKRSL